MTNLPIVPTIVTPTLAEVNPVNATYYAKEADLAAARFSYLVERRDQLHEKLRMGILALNGASLIGLLSALGGEGKAASWLGFTSENAKYSVAFFAGGIIAAGISAIVQANLFTNEAGDANTRRSQASWLASFHAAEASEANWNKLESLAEEFGKAPIVDFQYSLAAIILQNLAGGAWLAGILIPMWEVLF